jgi:ribosome maturation factor RimP
MSKALENKIAGLIAGKVESAGYDLVRVQIKGGGKYATLQVMAERKDGVGMTVEDCATISSAVCLSVEADTDLADRFDLEVSSPGIDRPLVKLQDFVRFQGNVAKVELNAPLEGQRRFQGKIENVSGEEIAFSVDKKVLKVSFKDIERAKLVLTDELLKAAASGKASH